MAATSRSRLEPFAAIGEALRDLPKAPGQILWATKAVFRRLCLLVRRRLEPRPQPSPCCLRLPDVYIRPDPLIYSQHYLAAQGLAVTWDNPDIQLYDAGTPVASHELE